MTVLAMVVLGLGIDGIRPLMLHPRTPHPIGLEAISSFLSEVMGRQTHWF